MGVIGELHQWHCWAAHLYLCHHSPFLEQHAIFWGFKKKKKKSLLIALEYFSELPFRTSLLLCCVFLKIKILCQEEASCLEAQQKHPVRNWGQGLADAGCKYRGSHCCVQNKNDFMIL